MTEQFCVVGSPISHSKSPVIHNACFRFLARDAFYFASEVTHLSRFLAEREDIAGLSVTMPLKEQAFEISTTLDPVALATGNVNTLIKAPGGWQGFNTDVFGLTQATSELSFKTLAILGTGSSARSALVAFSNHESVIWGRNRASSETLAAEHGAISVPLEDALSCDLVISTLPKGALRQIGATDSIYPGTLMDISYSNESNGALKFSGGQISGLDMLAWQALMQQRIFAGRKPSEAFENESKMLEVIMSALNMTK